MTEPYEDRGLLSSARDEYAALDALMRHMDTHGADGAESGCSVIEGLLRELVYLPLSAERSIPMQAVKNMNYWELALAQDLVGALDPGAGSAGAPGIVQSIRALRAEYETRGKTLPVIRVRDDPELPPRHAVLMENGAERWRGTLEDGNEAGHAIDVITATIR